MDDIRITSLDTIEEIEQVVALQRQVWGGPETDIAPLHVLTTVAHNGGVLLGAWHGAKLVGFVFGFIGTDDADPKRPALARLKHCSHMLGVLPAYRDKSVGLRLKLAQREVVNRQGIRLITWTYDPLESRNANLNIAHLGAICRHYLRDVYGRMADALNAGLPSDRFLVEWWITSTRVAQRLESKRKPLSLANYLQSEAVLINPAKLNRQGYLAMTQPPRKVSGTFALVEAPPNFQDIKSADISLAREWKAQVRAMFEEAFAAGYIVTDFLFEESDGRDRSLYVLTQGDTTLDGA